MSLINFIFFLTFFSLQLFLFNRYQDAIRDFSDLGLAIPVYELGGKGLKWGSLEEQIKTIAKKQGVQSVRDKGGGVIFATYTSLSTTKTGYSTPRYGTLLEWLKNDPSGEQGVIAFDEIHKAKNLVPPNPRNGMMAASKSSTKVGNAVHQMQLQVPSCRILYSSATGMSRPKAIAPFMRLGLWNDGPAETSTTPFTSFHDFMDVISPGRESQSVAMGRMEVVARELSTDGIYVSRSLAFNDTEFATKYVDIPIESKNGYDEATKFWTRLVIYLETTINTLFKHDPEGDSGASDSKKYLNAIVWGCHQRFFKSMMLSTKMSYLTKRAIELYENEGFAPVIALWSTAESAIQNVLQKDDEKLLDDIVSAPREALRKLLLHFSFDKSKWLVGSVWDQKSKVGGEEGISSDIARGDKMRHEEEWRNLIQVIDGMELPGNPLDLLIHSLGGPDVVAEMSGRSIRQVRESMKDAWQLESRSVGHDGLTSTSDINNEERKSFMEGIKKYAIITGAASAGISLHAERGCKNQRRRMMLVTELTWAADSTMQQFGRTHRSNQSSTPLYEIVVSSLGGESRFIGSITSRLQSLGALTKGDRGAAVGNVGGAGEFTGQTFFDRWGTEALRGVCDDIISDRDCQRPPPSVFSNKTWSLVLPLLCTKLQGRAASLLSSAAAAAASSSSSSSLPPPPLFSSSSSSFVHQQLIQRIQEYLLYDMNTYRQEALHALRSVQILPSDIQTCANLLGNGRGGTGGSKLDCKRFFNRLGGLHVRIQQNLYNHFKQTYDAMVDEAKANQEYHGVAGVLNSYYDSVTYNDEIFDGTGNEVVHTSDVGGVTRMVHLRCDAGMSYEDAVRELETSRELAKSYIEEGRVSKRTGMSDGFYWWLPMNSKGNKQEVVLVIEKPQLQKRTSRHDHGTSRGIRVLTPHKGSNTYRVGNVLGYNKFYEKPEMPKVSHIDRSMAEGRLHKIELSSHAKIVQNLWNQQYQLAEFHCSICSDCRLKDNHPKKKQINDPKWKCSPSRKTAKTLVCGCILQMWDVYQPTVRLSRGGGRRRRRVETTVTDASSPSDVTIDPETEGETGMLLIFCLFIIFLLFFFF